jgi:hypothetical protein
MGSKIENFYLLRSFDFGILKSTLSAAAVDFGVTEIKIVAKYFCFTAHCPDTLCTIKRICGPAVSTSKIAGRSVQTNTVNQFPA